MFPFAGIKKQQRDILRMRMSATARCLFQIAFLMALISQSRLFICPASIHGAWTAVLASNPAQCECPYQ